MLTKLPAGDLRNLNLRAHGTSPWYPAIPAVLFGLFVLLAGCEKQDAMIAGVKIPIPSGMTRVADKQFDPIPGINDGQAAFEGKATTTEIFNFYQENMEARGWEPTSLMVRGDNQVAYTKDGRICLVWYTPNPDGKISLIILIGTTKLPG